MVKKGVLLQLKVAILYLFGHIFSCTLDENGTWVLQFHPGCFVASTAATLLAHPACSEVAV